MIIRPEKSQELKALLMRKPLVLYGIGGAGVQIAKWCTANSIEYVFADRDAERTRISAGCPVYFPEDIPKLFPDANVVVSSIIYYDEIVEKLVSMGTKEENIISYADFMPNKVLWKDLENAIVWGINQEHTEAIVRLIPPDTNSVVDYGEGKISLRKFLPNSVEYYPVDYIKRSKETIVCDFNDGVFPSIRADTAVCVSTLVFLMTAEKLIEHICENTKNAIVLSYIVTERFPNIKGRRVSGYVNDFSENDIVNMLKQHGFELEKKEKDPANNIDMLYLFIKINGGLYIDNSTEQS